MKGYTTNRWNAPFTWSKWALLIGGWMMTLTPALSKVREIPTDNDTIIVVQLDSTKQVELPDSVIRREAKKLGMIDPDDVRNKIEVLKYLSPDSTLYKKDEFTAYDKRRIRNQKRWNKLIPNQATLQFAGSIGVLSAGIGWHYGKGDHWESELLIGFLPKFQSHESHATFTLKERYVPWHCNVSKRWCIEPLTTGIFFNTISGDHFWKNLPDVYPKKYYGFPTKLRTNIFIGQRVRYKIPRKKRLLNQAISFYYEISTCDLYLVSKVTNKDFPWKETLSLAFGLRWDM